VRQLAPVPDRVRRRDFIALLAGAAVARPVGARAQQAAKVPRIGVLDYASAFGVEHLWQAFRERLRELGYVEGENIAFEYRWADGEIERLPTLAAELVRLNVDIIAVSTMAAALVAKDATKTIPIVFRVAGDPIAAGLVQNLARPGGNLTGVSALTLDLAGKRLELLREIVPGVSRFAVLWERSRPISTLVARDTEFAARALGVSLQAIGVRDRNEFGDAFSAMRRERAGGFVVAPSAVFLIERRRLAELALENALPSMFPQRDYVMAGGLMSYGANLADDARRAAIYVDKILNGARPADLPVNQASKFELVVNLKTAKMLGLTIPESFLLRADEVIE
jgi:putative tryptophan/tyrosine transport system substrate-binding protein